MTTTMTADTELPDFDDNPVVAATIKLTNAGDGLSQAMEIDPRAIHVGDTGYMLIRWECVGIEHKRAPQPKARKRGMTDDEEADLDDEPLPFVRKHILSALVAKVVDDDRAIAKTLDAHKRKIDDARAKAKEEAAGTQRLDGTDADDTQPVDAAGLEAFNGDGGK